MTRMALALYCLLTCASSWAIQFAALAVAGDPESPQAGPWLAATMLTPALVAFLFIAFHKPARKSLMWKPRWRMLWLLPVAVAVPTLARLRHRGGRAPDGVGRLGMVRLLRRGRRGLGRALDAWPGLPGLGGLRGQCRVDRRVVRPAQRRRRGGRGARLARLPAGPDDPAARPDARRRRPGPGLVGLAPARPSSRATTTRTIRCWAPW